MYYVLAFLVGLVAGAGCFLLYVTDYLKKVKAREVASAEQATKAQQTYDRVREAQGRLDQLGSELVHQREDLARQREGLAQQHAEFDRRIISYKELQEENAILKRDLQNIDVNLRKLELDGEVRNQLQNEIDQRSKQLATRYLSETVKAVVATIGPSNFTNCKQRLIDVIGRCREIGFEIPPAEEAKLLADLRAEFERAVRASIAREEQGRIKAQIREEEKLKREIERELKQQEREKAAIQAALDQALAAAQGAHSAEVERLMARMAEIEEKSKRTLSMAEQTKAGHVYIISNIGSFGKDVYKIGMTRRLTPKERIDELGCAAVPFPFDVHMMIQCKDAPSLENALHRALNRARINKANPRKEFFRVQLEEIHRIAEQNCGTVEFVADAEALEYYQTLSMTDEDAAFIEHVYDEAEDETEIVAD